MRKKPSFEQLIDLQEGRLNSAEAERVRTWLADADVRQDVAWLTQFLQWCEQVELSAPPQRVRDELATRFARKFAPQSEPTLWQRLTAVLSVDSWGLQGLPAGVRSAEFVRQSRQLAYTTHPLDIILDINEGTINGQILPKSDSVSDDFVVQLVQQDESHALTNSDDFGEFRLNVDAGDYQLVLSNEQMEVWLPPIHVA